MKIWITGSNGMLGRECVDECGRRAIDRIATDAEVDITDPSALTHFAKGKGIDAIINCAAYTAVDEAEKETDLAFRVNATGAGNLSKLAHEIGARFIHVSTDYVFDGTKGSPYLPDDATNPVSAYGRSKLEGEHLVLSGCQSAAIVRSAWLYGSSGVNFVATMLRLFSSRSEVGVVDDQSGSPTLAGDLASVLVKMAAVAKTPSGIYHFTNSGQTTWYGFAKKIYELSREAGLTKNEVKIIPITTAEYPTLAIRPAYSVLDCTRIEREFKIRRRPWDEALREHIVFLKEARR